MNDLANSTALTPPVDPITAMRAQLDREINEIRNSMGVGDRPDPNLKPYPVTYDSADDYTPPTPEVAGPPEAPQEVPQETTKEKPKERSFGDVVKGIGAGIIRTPAKALGGTIDFAADAGSIGGELAAEGIMLLDEKFFNNRLAPAVAQKIKPVSDLGEKLRAWADKDGDGSTDLGAILSGATTGFDKIGNDFANNLTTDMGAALMGYGSVRRIFNRSGSNFKATREALYGALGAQVLDPDTDRVANFLKSKGVEDPIGFVDAMATAKDDSVLEKRIKMFAEDAALGYAFEGLLAFGKGIHALAKGDDKLLREAEKALVDPVVPPTTFSASPAPKPSFASQAAKNSDPRALKDPRKATSADDDIMDDFDGLTSADLVDDSVNPSTGLENDLTAFAGRAGVDADFSNVEIYRSRIVAPEGTSRRLNAVARREGAPDDIFIERPRAMAADNESYFEAVLLGPEVPNAPRLDYRDAGELGAVVEQGRKALDTWRAREAPTPPKTDKERIAQAKALAAEIGTDAQDAMNFLVRFTGKLDNGDVEMTAARRFVEDAFAGVDSIDLKQIDAMDPASYEAALSAVHKAVTFGEFYTKAGTASGRMQRARQVPSREDYFKTINDPRSAERARASKGTSDNPMADLPWTKDELKAWVQDFQRTKGAPHKRLAMLKDAVKEPPSALRHVLDSSANFFTASVLSGVRTVSLNVVAPSVISTYRTAQKSMGGITASAMYAARGNLDEAGKALSRARFAWTAQRLAAQQGLGLFLEMAGRLGTLNRKSFTGDLFGDSSPYYRAQTEGIGRAISDGRSVIGEGNFLDTPKEQWIKPSEEASFAAKTGYMLGNAINVFPTQFRRVSAGLDETAVRVAYAGEFANRLFEEAVEKGIKGADAVDYVRRKLPESLDEASRATDLNVLRHAQRSTLTYKAGARDARRGLISEDHIAGINRFRSDNPLARFVLPIFNTPAAGIGEFLRSVPGSHLVLKENADELSGRFGKAVQEEAHGRWMAATGLAVFGYQMTQEGRLSGGGPADPEAFKQWVEAGNQPYSIYVNGQWHDYSRFDQIGFVMGLLASVNDTTVYTFDADERRKGVTVAIGALAAYFKDRAAMQGVAELMGIDETNLGASKLNRIMQNIGSSMAVPGFVKSMADIQDPNKRRVQGFGDSVQNRIPDFLGALGIPTSSDLPQQVNLLGHPLMNPRETVLENVLPFTSTTPNKDNPVLNELEEMYKATGYVSGRLSTNQVTGGHFRPGDVIIDDVPGLSKNSDIVQQVRVLRGQISDPKTGRTLEQELSRLMASDAYRDPSRSSYGDAGRKFVDAEKTVLSRNYAVSKVFSRYNKLAKDALKVASPKGARALAAAHIAGRGMVELQEVRTIDIINDPERLRGINIHGTDAQDFYNSLLSGTAADLTRN